MFGLIFVIPLIAALAGGAAFALSVMVPRVEPRRRTLSAALAGALLPMSLPIAVMLVENGSAQEVLLPVVVLIILGVMLAALVGFPAAFWVTQRRERGKEPDVFR